MEKDDDLLVDIEVLEDMVEIIGEQAIRVNLIRFAAAAAYLGTNDTFLMNPPKGTPECLAQTIADLYFAMMGFVFMNSDLVMPEIKKRAGEWKKRARKINATRAPGSNSFQ